VINTCDRVTRKPFLLQKKIMLDWHPDINCYIKIFTHRGVGQGHDESSCMSFDEAADTYNACFVLDQAFKVNNIRGKLVFREECFRDGFLLPEYTVESE